MLKYGELLQKGEPGLHHVCLMSVYIKYVAAMKNEEQLNSLKVYMDIALFGSNLFLCPPSEIKKVEPLKEKVLEATDI